MIPRHRPPFSVATALATVLSALQTSSVEAVEEAYAEALNLHAVLLPSARAGICWALRTAVSSNTSIIGPAYTCQVVHEAMARSAGRLEFVDTEVNSFLMQPSSLTTQSGENCAVVLCEIYGCSYEAYDISELPRIRIIDAAMTVPIPQLFKRAKDRDCVILSFGIGKCMYAGYGGIAVSKNRSLIDEIRTLRSAYLSQETLLLSIRRRIEITLRTLAHTRLLYGLLYKCRRPPSDLTTFPSAWAEDRSLSGEWYLPSTSFDRRLALYNLENSTKFVERRKQLACRYHQNLEGVVGVNLPRPAHYAMSHYTIRVSAKARDVIQKGLWSLGIDAGTLFRFPSYLVGDRYPNARRIGSEVLNLPLDASLTDGDVDYISECVIHCVEKLSTCMDSTVSSPAVRSGQV
jgi:dTDP-4-amino-4,6-dideoxygalactose transaminase